MNSSAGSSTVRLKPERLVEARELSGLSRLQAARVLNVGPSSVAEAESGARELTPDEFRHFARVYDVSISWLAGHTPDPLDHATSKVGLAARDVHRLAPDQLRRLLHLLSILPRDSTSGS